jgi:hypothetical protein
VFAIAGAALAIWMMQSPETRIRPIVRAFTPLPPVEQPAMVEAFVTRLRTSPLLGAVDARPTSCSRVPKGAARDRCVYRGGETEIVVAWSPRSERLGRLTIRTTEPRGSAPFAWPGAAEAVSTLCGGLDADQANAVVREVPEKLSQAAWYLNGELVAAEVNGASRRIVMKPRDQCTFSFYENAKGSAVEWLLRASSRRPQG